MFTQNIFASNIPPDNQKKPINCFTFYFQGVRHSITQKPKQNQTKKQRNSKHAPIPRTHPFTYTLVVLVTEYSFTSLSEFDFL